MWFVSGSVSCSMAQYSATLQMNSREVFSTSWEPRSKASGMLRPNSLHLRRRERKTRRIANRPISTARNTTRAVAQSPTLFHSRPCFQI